MEAYFQKKMSDSEYFESTLYTDNNNLEIIPVGNKNNCLPEPPTNFGRNKCQRIYQATSNRTAILTFNPELYNLLPPKSRFIKDTLHINTRTNMKLFTE